MNNPQILSKRSRILVAAIAATCVLLSVIIVATTLSAREKKEENPPLVTDPDSSAATDAIADTPDSLPNDPEEPGKPDRPTINPDDTGSTQVGADNVLPEFIAPVVGSVIKEHALEVPVYSLTMDDYRTHTGVDIGANIGDPVRAVATGMITDIWDDPMMGKCLRIEHSGGAVSVYKNLAEDFPEGIESGASVKVGAVIGAIGETALIETAEIPHLHYELSVSGDAVDPCDFMLIGTTDTAYEG